ncbi:MAG: 4-alpha-glucanotransferase [Planctomycetes bacterium]|nr:4-alpha-glucanotransferase [Planctomycetota bacterium]
MPFPRLAGIILHPTSLPGGDGVGDLGEAARSFVDFLADSGMGIWQVLPLGPPGGSNSPYQSLSSHAGNPILISMGNLVDLGLLEPEDLKGAPVNTTAALFEPAARFKERALRKALENFSDACAEPSLTMEYNAFCQAEKEWLDDFALFAAAKSCFGGQPWYKWKDAELRHHEPKSVKKHAKLLSGEIRFQKFQQFLFFRQWRELRAYAAGKHVKLLGDIPIYCAHDSADVWAESRFFQLDSKGGAALMAGVPPDYFSATGQLWGNPLYNWKAMREDGYRWWRRRIRATLAQVDMLRIDHFRGFQAYWAVSKGETTAVNGRWLKGPGQELFEAFRKELGDNLPIVAEDLGIITPAVDKLRLDNNLPGMKVLHFAFSDGAESYLPHTYEPNTVCYVATHDNDTTRGWYEAVGDDYAHMSREAIGHERDRARRYLGRDGSDMTWDLMRLALSSVADTAILLMQDVLNLPNSCRMNRPGLGENQWLWRLTTEQLAEAPRGWLKDMAHLYGRQPIKSERKAAQDVETE